MLSSGFSLYYLLFLLMEYTYYLATLADPSSALENTGQTPAKVTLVSLGRPWQNEQRIGRPARNLPKYFRRVSAGPPSSKDVRIVSSLLTAVRVVRGVTQAELAARSGISQAEISHLEAGRRDATPSRLAALASALDVPTDLLVGEVDPPRILHLLQASLPSRAIHRLRAEVTLAGIRLDLLLSDASPAHELPSAHASTAAEAAHALRVAWHVPPGPIANLVTLVETHGIACLLRDLSQVKVHALGNWRAPERAFLFLNASSPPRKRRLALAHELGHALMSTGPSKQAEAGADAFAHEFLMPRADIEGQLWNLTWSRLGALEEEWGVPALTIAGRARDIRAISTTHHRRLRAELLDMGSDASAATTERPTLVASAIRRRGVSLAETAVDALTSAEELRRDYLAGAEATR